MEIEERQNINQVAAKLEVSPSTLRKYEEDYQLIFPRDELNRRYFTDKEIQVLKNILAMKHEGLNILAIKKILGKSVELKEQKEQAMELMTIDKLTAADFKEFLAENIAQIIAEKEQHIAEQYQARMDKMEQEFTTKLDNIDEELGRQGHQQKEENQKLMDYLEKSRQRGFCARVFNKERLLWERGNVVTRRNIMGRGWLYTAK